MPIACLWVPHFALRIESLDHPQLDGHPFILSDLDRGHPIVLETTPEALKQGVVPGMNLREARALCPDAMILMKNPVRELTMSDEIHQALDQCSPLVEPDTKEQGCWYIDLKGLSRYYGSFTGAAQELLRCVNPVLRPRIGVAPGKFPARVAAGVAQPGQVHTVEEDDVETFLERASVKWLPLPVEVINDFAQMGIISLGILAQLDRGKVTARFGPQGRLAWNLAFGRDDRPVVPPRRDRSVIEQLAMPTPAISREMLMVGLRQLVGSAFNHPDLKDRQIREVIMRALLEDNHRSWERVLTMKEPSGPTRVVRALNLRLQNLELPGPIESVSLEFRGISQANVRQQSLPTMGTRDLEPLTDAVHQLKHRYGRSPLYQIAEVEPWSRIPERRHALIAYEP